jgi:hypothetical protein
MYRISAPGQWASICQSPSAIRLLEKMTRGDLLILPICARNRCVSTPPGCHNQTDPLPARELRRRCDLQLREAPSGIREFIESHEGRDRQLPLPLRLV